MQTEPVAVTAKVGHRHPGGAAIDQFAIAGFDFRRERLVTVSQNPRTVPAEDMTE
jgi:hypothetical protein